MKTGTTYRIEYLSNGRTQKMFFDSQDEAYTFRRMVKECFDNVHLYRIRVDEIDVREE